MIQTLKEATDIEDIVVSWKKKKVTKYIRGGIYFLYSSVRVGLIIRVISVNRTLGN